MVLSSRARNLDERSLLLLSRSLRWSSVGGNVSCASSSVCWKYCLDNVGGLEAFSVEQAA
jgi:hypothetical protein